MIHPERLYDCFKRNGVEFFTGVPDSLLKDLLKFIDDNSNQQEHIITANEGLAVALAAGHYMGSGKVPVVYLQNSGLGNIINPLTSLADNEMYAIPMILLVGWRGRPGTADEPQHLKMGRITIPLLDVLEVPYFFLDSDETFSFDSVAQAIEKAKDEQIPVALIVPEGIFEKYIGNVNTDEYSLLREQVIKKIIYQLSGDEIVVCTTGKSGREFYEQNIIAGNKIKKYLLNVGAMGHANHLALGIKLGSDDKVIMFDGDGALLMHLGSLPAIAHHVKKGYTHIVLNNGSHESVGGQPTEAFFMDCCAVAKACGYNETLCIKNESELDEWIMNGLGRSTLQFVEIRTSKFSRDDLGRPAGSPSEWKEGFITSLFPKNHD